MFSAMTSPYCSQSHNTMRDFHLLLDWCRPFITIHTLMLPDPRDAAMLEQGIRACVPM